MGFYRDLYWYLSRSRLIIETMEQYQGKPIIFKLSSLAVTHEQGGFNYAQVKQILSDIMALKKKWSVIPIIVTSGAINAGRPEVLGEQQHRDIAELQACAAIGQAKLMNMFQKKLAAYDVHSAQILLTHEDLRNKQRSLNIKNTLNKLISRNIIPIINENDSVSFDEISFGDNDQLSAMICELVSAPLLLMLTRANGLYDRDPAEEGAERFTVVAYDNALEQVKTLTKTSTGKGGMKTKLAAVRKLTPLGIDVIISSYSGKSPILNALDGKAGTLFEHNPKPDSLKKRSWILTRAREHAAINIDKGAYEALKKNASLLPVGVKSVTGPFRRGDSIPIRYGQKIVAYGISEYNAREAELIKQQHSRDLTQIIKQVHSRVLVHKDNLILKSD